MNRNHKNYIFRNHKSVLAISNRSKSPHYNSIHYESWLTSSHILIGIRSIFNSIKLTGMPNKRSTNSKASSRNLAFNTTQNQQYADKKPTFAHFPRNPLHTRAPRVFSVPFMGICVLKSIRGTGNKQHLSKPTTGRHWHVCATRKRPNLESVRFH